VSARRSVLGLALLALSACAVGPRYRRPEVVVPAEFRGAEGATSTASLADLGWWQVFRDPALVALLNEAVANNQDLAAALARVAEARASVGAARADLYPHAEGTLSADRTRLSESVVNVGPVLSSDFRAAIGASWELDLWGRVRRGAEAACADAVASEEGRRGAVVALVGDVAEAYFELLDLDLELEITKATRTAREGTTALFERRHAAGAASALERTQAAADLAVARAAVPLLEQRIGQQENRIAFLVGRAPGSIARGVAPGAAWIPPELPAGLPCALIERRPDVLAAEAAVVAANARIGVAEASFFPRVDLASMIGLESGDLSDLVKDRSRIASVGASLTAPIFQGGALTAERRRAVARWREAVALYRRAVQNALRDVSDQLIAVRWTRAVREEVAAEVEARQAALTLVTSRYEDGLSTYFEVLDAQRRLFPAQIEAARAAREQRLALVRLYRALGGGWQGPGLRDRAP
jgi:multidrug efflux system outer membrane protein